MEKGKKIPAATIFRLSVYRQHLLEMRKQGRRTVSSLELASAARVNPAQLRKDLSYFGRFGVRGVGYSVDGLLQEISTILGLRRPWNLCVLGGGKVGRAIIVSGHLEQRGYFVEAVFDSRPEIIGHSIGPGLVVEDIRGAGMSLPQKEVFLCMITEEVPDLNGCVHRLLDAGIRGFLSLVPVSASIPPTIPVQYMDFTTLLDTLAYTLTHGVNRGGPDFLEGEPVTTEKPPMGACLV